MPLGRLEAYEVQDQSASEQRYELIHEDLPICASNLKIGSAKVRVRFMPK